MGKGIILRVPESTKLSPELKQAINELLPNYKFEDYLIEKYSTQLDSKVSIARRIDSLYKAFLFVLEAYPPDPTYTPITIDTFKNNAAKYREECNLDSSSLTKLQVELEKFTARLVEMLYKSWHWSGSSFREAVACLNEAEQYVLMSQGRNDLATLVPIQWNNGETRFALQLDEPIPSYRKQFISELKALKKLDYIKTPSWFKDLSDYQKAYFCNLSSKQSSLANLKLDLQYLINKVKKIKEASNNFKFEEKQIREHSPLVPKWFDELEPCHKEMLRVIIKNGDDLDSKLNKFSQSLNSYEENKEFESTFDKIPALPQWYWVLSVTQQAFLSCVLKKSKSIEETVSFLPSRLRQLPALPNFMEYGLYILDNKQFKLLLDKGLRSSHMSSRVCDESVREYHSEVNFARVCEFVDEGQLLSVLTLVSPNYGIHCAKETLPKQISDKLPEDYELDINLNKAIEHSPFANRTFKTNHCLNILKYWNYTQKNDARCLHILKTAKSYYKTYPGLEELCKEYEEALDSKLGSATVRDYVCRELFLSCLEDLITLKMEARSYGSCVSGKDRMALKIIHKNAMILFKERFGFWPKFDDTEENRRNFVEIVATLYCSYHQHILAGHNAPGAEGIKTTSTYYPEDICEAIIKKRKDDSLDDDDQLATNNEVKKISDNLRHYFISKDKDNLLLCKSVAEDLGEKRCEKLYTLLVKLVNEKDLFYIQPSSTYVSKVKFFIKKMVSGKLPEGISKIHSLIHDIQSGDTNIERLSKIFLEVLERDEKDETRTKATNSVYTRIRQLLTPHKEDQNLDFLYEETMKEWGNLFEKSKNDRHESINLNQFV